MSHGALLLRKLFILVPITLALVFNEIDAAVTEIHIIAVATTRRRCEVMEKQSVPRILRPSWLRLEIALCTPLSMFGSPIVTQNSGSTRRSYGRLQTRLPSTFYQEAFLP